MDQPEDTTTFGTVLSSEGCGGARRSAEAVTRAVKERLHKLGRDFHLLADAADRAEQTSDPLRLSNESIAE